jgi:hypothetical protein
VQKVILQLGESAAKIEGTIADLTTDQKIRKATITLRRADNPDLLYRTSTDDADPGTFEAVVPMKPFTMTVESPGYEPWTYGDDGTRARMPLSMNSIGANGKSFKSLFAKQ